MTRRAVRWQGGFLPESDRVGRYAAPRSQRPWTPGQTAVLIVATTACRNRAAFDGMSVPLLEALGHPPLYRADMIVSPRRHMDNCVRRVELCLVTEWMGRRDGRWEPRGVLGWFPARDRDALTWGEKVKLIRPWLGRINAGKRCVAFADLQNMLRRYAEKRVLAYLGTIRENPGHVDVEAAGRPPVTAANAVAVRRAADLLDEGVKDAAKALWGVFNGR